MTPKQELFCLEYLIDLNATQAALRAGYSAKTAFRIGAENMQKHAIRERIDNMLTEMKSKRIADATEVMETLTRVLRREEADHVVLRKLSESGEGAELLPVPTKVSDVNKAAELLGKRYQLYTDRVDVTGDITIVIEDDYGDDGG